MTLRIEDATSRIDIVPESMVSGMIKPENIVNISKQLMGRYVRTITASPEYGEAVRKIGYQKDSDNLITNETVVFERNGISHAITYRNDFDSEYLRVELHDEGETLIDVMNHWTVWSDEGQKTHGFVGHYEYGFVGALTTPSQIDSFELVSDSIASY